jgi:hypothetical protein
MYRDRGCLAKWGYNFGDSAGVNLANHLYQIRGEAHMREGDEESRVRDAAKSITDIQPRNTKRTGLPFGVIYKRFQQESIFITSFAGASTLLFVG